jgi:uncharacterized UPF0146 family protein
VTHDRTTALTDRLARHDSLVEVGVGRRPSVAAALVGRGRSVTATDVRERSVPDGVRFRRDDVVAASERDEPGATYRAEALYALNCPPELQRPLVRVARAVDAACYFTTLGGDPPVVPVARETLPGETLFVADERPARP